MRTKLPLLSLAAAAALAVPMPALAQASDSDTGEVAINGRVTPICILGEPSQPVVDLGQLIELSGSRVGRIAALGAQTVTMPDSFCNFAGSVATIEATALVETSSAVSTPPASFARAVNYDASAGTWGGGTASTTTFAAADGSNPTSEGDSAVQGTPRLTDIVVNLGGWSAPGDNILVAGDYAGLVRVTIGPATVAQ